MDEKMKSIVGISAIAVTSYIAGRAIEFVGKKAYTEIKKVIAEKSKVKEEK